MTIGTERGKFLGESASLSVEGDSDYFQLSQRPPAESLYETKVPSIEANPGTHF